MSPMSCMSTKRLTWLCRSTPAKAARNSRSVSGPNVENVTSPPARSTRPSSASACGRSSDPLQREVAPGEIERSGGERQRGRRRRRHSPASPRAPPDERGKERARTPTFARAPSPRAAASIGSATSSATWRASRIAQREIGLRVAGAAAGVEDGGRSELHDVEPLGHPPPDFALQHGGGVVGRGGAREMAAHGARIHARRDRRRTGAQRASRKSSSAAPKASACDRNGTCAAPGDQREARIRQTIGEAAPGAGKRQRVAIAGDDERRLRDAGDLAAQVGVAQHGERAGERRRRRRAAREEPAAQLREHRARRVAALQLQREEALHGELPRDAQFVAEAVERLAATSRAASRRPRRTAATSRRGRGGRPGPAPRAPSASRPARRATSPRP